MTDWVLTSYRAQTFGEELANSLSHGLGLLASIGALPILVVGAIREGGSATVVGASVFCTSIVSGLDYVLQWSQKTIEATRA